MERKEGERLTKRADAFRVEGRKGRRREDCVKSDLEGNGGRERGTVGSGDGWWRGK